MTYSGIKHIGDFFRSSSKLIRLGNLKMISCHCLKYCLSNISSKAYPLVGAKAWVLSQLNITFLKSISLKELEIWRKRHFISEILMTELMITIFSNLRIYFLPVFKLFKCFVRLISKELFKLSIMDLLPTIKPIYSYFNI